MIVEGLWYIPAGGQFPFAFVSREAAELPCGCRIYVGVRTDKGEQTTMAVAHAPEHQHVVAEGTDRLEATIGDPKYRDRRTVEVVDECLAAVGSGP